MCVYFGLNSLLELISHALFCVMVLSKYLIIETLEGKKLILIKKNISNVRPQRKSFVCLCKIIQQTTIKSGKIYSVSHLFLIAALACY